MNHNKILYTLIATLTISIGYLYLDKTNPSFLKKFTNHNWQNDKISEEAPKEETPKEDQPKEEVKPKIDDKNLDELDNLNELDKPKPKRHHKRM